MGVPRGVAEQYSLHMAQWASEAIDLGIRDGGTYHSIAMPVSIGYFADRAAIAYAPFYARMEEKSELNEVPPDA
jgi:hypothetical protein